MTYPLVCHKFHIFLVLPISFSYFVQTVIDVYHLDLACIYSSPYQPFSLKTCEHVKRRCFKSLRLVCLSTGYLPGNSVHYHTTIKKWYTVCTFLKFQQKSRYRLYVSRFSYILNSIIYFFSFWIDIKSKRFFTIIFGIIPFTVFGKICTINVHRIQLLSFSA